MTGIDICVGTNLKLKRIASGLSQAELADKLGVSEPLIKAWEQGTTRLDDEYMFHLQIIMGINPSDLFKGLTHS